MTLDQLAEQAARRLHKEAMTLGELGDARNIADVAARLRPFFEAATQAQREQLEQAQKAAQVAALNLASVMARSEQQKERAEKAEQHLAQVTQERDALSAAQEGIRQFVERERGIRDSITKGGQHTGTMPRISPSVLKELERLLPCAPTLS